MNRAYIISDDREGNGAIPGIEPILELNNNKQGSKLSIDAGGGIIQHCVSRRDVGDYVICIRSKKNPDHFITAIVIERKTWKDLAASIKDKRSESQHRKMLDMKAATGCLIYYVIEGVMKKNMNSVQNVPVENLNAKLRKNTLRGVPFFRTNNTTETAELLVSLTRDVMKLYASDELAFPLQEPRNYMHDMGDFAQLIEKYADSPFISDIKALCNKIAIVGGDLTLTSDPMKNVFVPQKTTSEELEMNMWRTFTGVGPSTAEALSTKYTIKQLFIERPDILAEPIVTSSGTRVKKQVLMNVMVSLGDRMVQAKILAVIPKITVESAFALLEHTTIENLMTGEVDEIRLEVTTFDTKNRQTKFGHRIKSILDVFQQLPMVKDG